MKKNTSKLTAPKKEKKEKKVPPVVWVGLGLSATGLLGYLGYQYYKKLQDAKAQENKSPSSFTPPSDIPVYNSPPKTEPIPIYETPKTKDDTNYHYNSEPKSTSVFPLRRGSKGEKVKQLQQALIANYGKSILPKYGADGDFGRELSTALKRLKYPATISESTFYVITGSNVNDSSLAKQFYASLSKSDYAQTMSLLAKLKNTTEYNTVSSEFKLMRLHGGVRQTLVNATLNTFIDKTQKQEIRKEFLRIGLKYNGNRWSLDGLHGASQIITTEATQVWLDGFRSLNVPKNMILGTPLAERLDFTLFEKDNRYFLVKTNSIRKI